MQIVKRVGDVGAVVSQLVGRPSDARFLGRLWETTGERPLEARHPWLPFACVDYLDAQLHPGAEVLEFGGGGSTLWFADRGARIVSIEHDPAWAAELSAAVEDVPGARVEYRTSDDDYRGYVAAADEFPADHFDVVLVDGRARVRCIVAARSRVRPGGLLLLDDADRDKYQEAFAVLQDWELKVWRGLTPWKRESGATAVWRRPLTG